jgi:hypothetical protein
MRLFLDTEFNGFMGGLMSMALVPEDDSVLKFYKELEMKDQLDPWVKEHVVPFLDGKPLSRSEFQNSLASYLWIIGECTIVADWPDDIRHFCESLIVGPGDSIALVHKIHFVLDTKLPYVSQVPHHALFDAIGIREAYLEKLNERK